MKNRKRIFAILLFLLLALIMYVSANPSGKDEKLLMKDPVISISKDNDYTIDTFGKIPTFRAKALDAQGNELTVKITNNINNKVPGKYKVIFTTVDLQGNKTTIEREFIVVEPTIITKTAITPITNRLIVTQPVTNDQNVINRTNELTNAPKEEPTDDDLPQNPIKYDYVVNYYIDGTEDAVPGVTTPVTGEGTTGQVIAITHPETNQGYKVKTGQPTSVTISNNNTSVNVYYVYDESQWVDVTFNPGLNGTLSGTTPFNVLKDYPMNSSIQPNPVSEPTKIPNEGYIFSSWDKELNLSAIATEDTSFIAQWISNTYTIIFHDSGYRTGGFMNPKVCTYGVPCALPKNDFTKSSYEFYKWGTQMQSNGNTPGNIADKSEVIDLAKPGETVILYAWWTK